MTSEVIKVTSHIGQQCKHCDTWLPADYLEGAIVHYNTFHGFELAHIGTETENSDSGQLWYYTAAYLKSAGKL